jgi:hypothetical protein
MVGISQDDDGWGFSRLSAGFKIKQIEMESLFGRRIQ